MIHTGIIFRSLNHSIFDSMKTILLAAFFTSAFIHMSCTSHEPKDKVYESIQAAFLNPAGTARPKVYWWCLNGNIDTVRAGQELEAMKAAGIGGFDFFEIGVPKQDAMIPGGPAFLSDESLKLIKFVIDKAGKLGLTVGFNVASSWNAGGSWVKPRHGSKSLYFSETYLKGHSGMQKIRVPFPKVSFPEKSLVGYNHKSMIPFREDGRPVYYEEVAVLAIPANIEKHALDTAQVVDVTRFLDSVKDELSWEAPPGEWKILRFICSNSGQQLVLPSPLSAGLVIDHFDSAAVSMHFRYVISRLQSVLGDFRKTALKSLYLASYEARGFVWTPAMASAFKQVNGYEINKFIPALFDSGFFSPETNARVQKDFKKTLSELMINNLYKNAKDLCHRYGLEINCEAGGPGYPLFNGPAEPLKALGTLDIPRGEFWVNYARYYKSENGRDSIDILRVVKEVAAASHIYDKKWVEEESFTSFQHWQEGPSDIRPFGDRAFCEGMNRVVIHGFSHNIRGSGYPGFVYHAGTDFNDKRVWWPMARPFVDYLARLSSVFQHADFTSDVVWYYGDKIPNSAAPKNTRFCVGPGYDYEVINTDILLNKLTVKDGRLVLPNGETFSLLALADETEINPRVLIRLKELAKSGAVITGRKPKSIAEIKNPPLTEKEGAELIRQLWTVTRDEKDAAVSVSTPLELLKKLGVPPDFSYRDKETFLLDYIHYKKNDIDFYFIRNTTDRWVSRACSFRQKGKIPEIWDPVSGDIIPVTVYEQYGEYVSMPLTLAPYGSQLIVLRKGTTSPGYSRIKTEGQDPPLLIFTKEGFLLLNEGNAELIKHDKSTTTGNKIQMQTLEGSWEVSFPENRGAPQKLVFPELISWTRSNIAGVKYFSGTATYKRTFEYDVKPQSADDVKIYLDLGEASKVAEVWLNDKHLGITWTKPHMFDVTGIIRDGVNELSIDVANTWSNRLTGDAVTGDNYTNSNIMRTIVATKGMLPGDQTHVPWADVPLIESGLLGPVRIETMHIILSFKRYR